MATRYQITAKREVVSLELKNLQLPLGESTASGKTKVLSLTLVLPTGITRREMLSEIGNLASSLVLPERSSRMSPASASDRALYPFFLKVQAQGPQANEAVEAFLSELQDLDKIEDDPAAEGIYLMK